MDCSTRQNRGRDVYNERLKKARDRAVLRRGKEESNTSFLSFFLTHTQTKSTSEKYRKERRQSYPQYERERQRLTTKRKRGAGKH